MNAQKEKNSKNTKPLVYAHVSKRVELTYEPKYESRVYQVLNYAAKTVSNAAQNVSDSVHSADRHVHEARYENAMNKPQPIGRS